MHTAILSRSLAIGTVTFALALAGCAADSSGSGSGSDTTATTPAAEFHTPVPVDDTAYIEDRVRLNDGRDVTCLRYRDKLLSCDWNGAGATADTQR